jgi:hypothetical protein
LVQAFLKKWWVESDFKAPNPPLSLRLKGSGCHYNSIYNNTKLKKYHGIGTVQNSNRKIVELEIILIHGRSLPLLGTGTSIHDRSLSWLGTGTSIHDRSLSWLGTGTSIHDRSLSWLGTDTSIHDRSLSWLGTDTSIHDRSLSWLGTNTSIHDRSLSWLGTGTSIKSASSIGQNLSSYWNNAIMQVFSTCE